MRVFVAGATGAIGRRLVPMLVQAGHEVTPMTRSPDRAARLESEGLRAVVCDAYDADALRRAMLAARPEAVIHELTDIPADVNPRRFAEQFRSTDRLRTEGTRNLLAGAQAVGARRFIAQSIFSAYQPVGGPIKREADRLWSDPPEWAAPIRAVAEVERLLREAEDLETLALRYGYFYGPGTAYASDGSVAERVRKRAFPIGRGASGLWSFIHVDDAAGATLAALDRGDPGAYNVVDDEPATAEAWLPRYAEAVEAPKPLRVPGAVIRLGGGPYAACLMYELRGASNEKAKRELGWSPAHSSWREGFRKELG